MRQLCIACLAGAEYRVSDDRTDVVACLHTKGTRKQIDQYPFALTFNALPLIRTMSATTNTSSSTHSAVGPGVTAAVSGFRWIELLEKEFDKSFVAMDEVLRNYAEDYEVANELDQQRKLLANMGHCFVQSIHKAQTIFQVRHIIKVSLFCTKIQLLHDSGQCQARGRAFAFTRRVGRGQSFGGQGGCRETGSFIEKFSIKVCRFASLVSLFSTWFADFSQHCWKTTS